MKLTLIVCIFLTLHAFSPRTAAAETMIVNGNFEQGPADAPPPGWLMPQPIREDGWRVRIVTEEAAEGRQCALVERSSETAPKIFGNLMQTIDATPWRGQRIRLSARIRHTGLAGTQSQLWMRVDRAGRKPGFFDNCKDRPVKENAWGSVEIIGDVAEDAERIALGLMVFGNGGSAKLDDVRLESVGAAAPIAPPRAVSDQGLENLVAFTRLLGYVRYFHPSDQAAAMTADEWDQFTVEGLRDVESCGNAAELAEKLGALFHRMAPLVIVSAEQNPKPPALPRGPFIHTWHHEGLGISASPGGNVYRSERVRADADSKNADEDRFWARNLGGGVTCMVPLAVYGDNRGTLPHADKIEVQKMPSLTGASALSPRDRTVRLAAVASAWNVPEHFFPYFDVVKSDWQAVLRDSFLAAAVDQDEESFYLTLQRLGAALCDAHVNLFGPGMPEPFLPNVRLEWAEGKLCVAQSQVAALAPGDALLAVDDVPIEKAVQLCLRQCSAPSPQGSQWLAARHLLAGPRGTGCRIRIDPFDAPGSSREITLRRDTQFNKMPRPARDRTKELAPGIFYIDLEQWTAAEFQASWEKLGNAKGLIFDFRNYPDKLEPFDFFGHLSAIPLQSPQWHIPTPNQPDREGLEFAHLPPWVITPREPLVACRKVFLINAGCVSFAESCLGIVEHYKLGELVGGPTIGTNGNINLIKLPGGYSLTWTGMKVLKHDGTQHHGIGIRPTVTVETTRGALAQGRDETMEKALEMVSRRDPQTTPAPSYR